MTQRERETACQSMLPSHGAASWGSYTKRAERQVARIAIVLAQERSKIPFMVSCIHRVRQPSLLTDMQRS